MRSSSRNSYEEVKKEYEQKKEFLDSQIKDLIKNHEGLDLIEVQSRKRRIETLSSDTESLEKKLRKLKKEALRSGKKKR